MEGWNKIPSEVKHGKSVTSFKGSYKKHRELFVSSLEVS
jgi:hypothetical protein